MAVDRRYETGPFDIIGDVHGCADELRELLLLLGYAVSFSGRGAKRGVAVTPPAGRRVIFVGDLVDRGPHTPDVLRIAMEMAKAGQAFCVLGNHDDKFRRWLLGRKVKLSHGLERSVTQINKESEAFRAAALDYLEGLETHLWLDDGALVIAHAGIAEEYIGISSGKERHFCLYGDTSGGRDDYGLPIRYNWAADYAGEAAIVYGHTPIPEPRWQNNTLCIDTGCVFGGALTALRWPEREIVAVPAKRAYAKKIRPFAHPPDRPKAQ